MSDQNTGYEKRDTSIRTIMVATVVTVLVIAISVILLYDYFIATKEAVVYDQALKPEAVELLELRQTNDSLINTTALLDSVNGTYRIPIERAMQLLVAESAGTSPDK